MTNPYAVIREIRHVRGIAEHEGSSFWTQFFTELNNMVVKDVFVFCVDGLTGLPDAIIRQCLIISLLNVRLNYSVKYKHSGDDTS